MRRTGSDLSVSLYVSRNRYSIRFGRTDRIFPSLYTTIICIIIPIPVINKRVILVLMCKNNYCDASQPQNAILLSPAVSYRIVSLSLSLFACRIGSSRRHNIVSCITCLRVVDCCVVSMFSS